MAGFGCDIVGSSRSLGSVSLAISSIFKTRLWVVLVKVVHSWRLTSRQYVSRRFHLSQILCTVRSHPSLPIERGIH